MHQMVALLSSGEENKSAQQTFKQFTSNIKTALFRKINVVSIVQTNVGIKAVRY